MRSVTPIHELEALHEGAYGWSLHCCGKDPEAAKDVLQSSYARVLSGTAGHRGDGSLRSFLFGVIRRVALEEFRRGVRERDGLRERGRRSAPSSIDGRAGADPIENAEREELHRRIRAALATLSPRQQEILHLTFYQGLTVEQSADVLSIAVGSARKHYERGKDSLRHRCASFARYF